MLNLNPKIVLAMLAAMWIGATAIVMAPLSGCDSTQGPIDAPKATPAQLKAAGRFGLTAMEQNGIDLHGAGVLKGNDWSNYVSACKTARGLLYQSGLAGFTEVDIAKAIAIAKAAVKTGQAAWIMANAASVSDEDAAAWEADGQVMDATFDQYVAENP